jgi:hypothetical protein
MSGKGSGSKSTSSQAAANNRSNQMNPNSAAYKSAQDNRANQLNPNSAAYQASRQSGGSGSATKK